jgi:nitrite reductase/ring-hydroxylating ferredoxin subunit
VTTLLNVDWRSLPNAPAAGTPLCTPQELPFGETVEFVFAADTALPLFRLIVHSHDGGINAYVNQCPHHWLPMNRSDGKFLKWSEHQLMCSHHSAVFDLALSGICIMGPCQGSNLIAVPVVIVNDQVVITAGD